MSDQTRKGAVYILSLLESLPSVRVTSIIRRSPFLLAGTIHIFTRSDLLRSRHCAPSFFAKGFTVNPTQVPGLAAPWFLTRVNNKANQASLAQKLHTLMPSSMTSFDIYESPYNVYAAEKKTDRQIVASTLGTRAH